jgi:hypothetical protein
MSSTPLHFAADLLAAVLFGFGAAMAPAHGAHPNQCPGCRRRAAFVMAGLQLYGDSSAPGRIASFVVSGAGFLEREPFLGTGRMCAV